MKFLTYQTLEVIWRYIERRVISKEIFWC